MEAETITLFELTNRIGQTIYRTPGTQNVWVTAELSDVSTKGGHTYMELIQKDDTGRQLAKIRAMIWRNDAYQITRFEASTGQKFATGIKLKVRASATMHPVFGLSLTISEIDPFFTMGDLYIRRQEIIRRLQADGVFDDNKKLSWHDLSLRVAVISAEQAAGYGDFMKHLTTAGQKFRFVAQLFPAVMQGERTVPTVLDALARIEDDGEQWDCVVVIRGGGASSDLASFENYDLAYRIATFHIPVIVGIGHERDETVLDYVANRRVKTPTAAADILLNHWTELYQKLLDFGRLLQSTVQERVGAENMQLSYFDSNLNNFSAAALERTGNRLLRSVMTLESVNNRSILPARQRLAAMADKLCLLSRSAVSTRRENLEAKKKLLDALSPEAVLKRGYTLTMTGGRILKSAKETLPHGTELITRFNDGEITSTTQ